MMARNRKFPTFGFILLILATLWLLNELNIIITRVPWFPVILIIVAIGMIYNRLA